MLDIVASYYYMQFQGKIMKQIRENDKKHIFGPKFGHQSFFSKIWLRHSLDIMVSHYHVQYQKILMIQS